MATSSLSSSSSASSSSSSSSSSSLSLSLSLISSSSSSSSSSILLVSKCPKSMMLMILMFLDHRSNRRVYTLNTYFFRLMSSSPILSSPTLISLHDSKMAIEADKVRFTPMWNLHPHTFVIDNTTFEKHTTIHDHSPKGKDSVLPRLTLFTSLESLVIQNCDWSRDAVPCISNITTTLTRLSHLMMDGHVRLDGPLPPSVISVTLGPIQMDLPNMVMSDKSEVNELLSSTLSSWLNAPTLTELTCIMEDATVWKQFGWLSLEHCCGLRRVELGLQRDEYVPIRQVYQWLNAWKATLESVVFRLQVDGPDDDDDYEHGKYDDLPIVPRLRRFVHCSKEEPVHQPNLFLSWLLKLVPFKQLKHVSLPCCTWIRCDMDAKLCQWNDLTSLGISMSDEFPPTVEESLISVVSACNHFQGLQILDLTGLLLLSGSWIWIPILAKMTNLTSLNLDQCTSIPIEATDIQSLSCLKSLTALSMAQLFLSPLVTQAIIIAFPHLELLNLDNTMAVTDYELSLFPTLHSLSILSLNNGEYSPYERIQYYTAPGIKHLMEHSRSLRTMYLSEDIFSDCMGMKLPDVVDGTVTLFKGQTHSFEICHV